MSLLGLSRSTSVDVQKFLAYEPTSLMKPEPGLVKQNAANIYKCSNGLEIEVATIHAVKGETHDATLILETKFNYFYDLKSLLDFFIDDGKDSPMRIIPSQYPNLH